jgi:hypothetical protein
VFLSQSSRFVLACDEGMEDNINLQTSASDEMAVRD